MKKDGESDRKPITRKTPENKETMQISNKDHVEEVKKERCEPCMHCGVHCIFLREDK